MNLYNFWQTMSQELQTELNQVVKGTIYEDLPEGVEPDMEFPLLLDLSYDTVNLYKVIKEDATMFDKYSRWQAGGTVYILWSLYSLKPDNVQIIKNDFDMLEAAYPTDFSISGAWRFDDGRAVGTQWVDPEDHSQGVTGNPWYSNPQQLINFMPDVKVPGPGYPGDPNDYTEIPPTELADVVLKQGQAPRIFM